MNPQLKRVLIFIVALVFIVLGLIGFALPFLQGFLFLFIGLILLSISSQTARTWIEHYTRKYPKVHAWVEKMEKRITKIIGNP
ncbi:MAG TPA: PGPGW domain-containing protein [Candidatus Paceibacterota bacterium]